MFLVDVILFNVPFSKTQKRNILKEKRTHTASVMNIIQGIGARDIRELEPFCHKFSENFTDLYKTIRIIEYT